VADPKYRFSPMVIKHLRRRYACSGGARQLAKAIEEETGYKMSHQTLLKLVDDDDYIQEPYLDE